MSKIAITPNASGTGTINIVAPNTNTDRTLTIPDITGNVVTTGDTGTVTMSMLATSGTLPALDGSALTGLSAVVRQVVHGSDTDGYSETTSSSWSTVYSVNITPTASDSRFVAWFTGNLRSQRSGDQLMALVRVGRTISGGSFVQLDASDSGYANDQSVRQHIRYINYPAAAAISSDFAFMEIDTTSTTSQITYEIQHNMQSSQAFQRTGGSSIIVMEIAP